MQTNLGVLVSDSLIVRRNLGVSESAYEVAFMGPATLTLLNGFQVAIWICLC